MQELHLKLLLYGVSGAGKSTLARTLTEIDPRCTLHVKDTTRPPEPRDLESLDINSVSKAAFHENNLAGKYAYVYKYGEAQHSYGIVQEQLTEAARRRRIHLIIVRDIHTIRALLSTYFDTRAIYLYVDPDAARRYILSREESEERKAERVKRLAAEYNEYVAHSGLFDAVLLNYADPGVLCAQMRNLIARYERVANQRGGGA